MEETFYKICQNPWCKGGFNWTKNDIRVIDGVEVQPSQCPKCISFATELSGGISWVDKTYEGSIWDDAPHQIKYKVTNWKL